MAKITIYGCNGEVLNTFEATNVITTSGRFSGLASFARKGESQPFISTSLPFIMEIGIEDNDYALWREAVPSEVKGIVSLYVNRREPVMQFKYRRLSFYGGTSIFTLESNDLILTSCGFLVSNESRTEMMEYIAFERVGILQR